MDLLRGAVMQYRLYVLNRSGEFVDVIDLRCAGDDEARGEAERRLGPAPSIEVWQRARFVGQVVQPLAI